MTDTLQILGLAIDPDVVLLVVAVTAFLLALAPGWHYLSHSYKIDEAYKKSAIEAVELVKQQAKHSDIATLIFENSPGEYHVAWANDAWYDLTHTKPGEANEQVWKTVHPDDIEPLKTDAEAAGDRRWSFEEKYRIVDPYTGEFICHAQVHSDLLPSPDEDKWGYVSQIRCVGRSPHEAAVETALNIIKAGGRVDPHPTLIYKITTDGYELIWCNAAWAEWTGLNHEESASGMDLETVDPAVREHVGEIVAKAGQAKVEMDLEYDLYRPHSGEMWGRVWVHGHPIYVADPKAWYYVSRLRRAEDRLTVPPPPT